MVMHSRSPSGFSTWRFIADELRGEIVDGGLAPGTRLPSESQLARRFGVNRNTVRQAVAALAADDLVVARRGSGTFVAEHEVLVHRIGVRTRLSDSLGERAKSATARLLGSEIVPAPESVAKRLHLGDRHALRMEIVRGVDGRPISLSTNWFDAERVPGLAEGFVAEQSLTRALREQGIDAYVRGSTMIAARHATASELTDLELLEGAVVLAVEGFDVLPDGTPLQLAVTRFPADRVELDVDPGR
ncbi:phosphonate metabolism transcriptional regulator PhnF [Gordonia sp. 135]|nr:phosphonate metabolism transcriptional regulator PhnF [Gordonia sp. 135]